MIRRLTVLTAALAAAVILPATAAWAGSPHFVDDTVQVVAADDGTLVVSGKEAGLGNEEQVHVVATATASCVNGGGNHPQAANKQTVSAEGDFPVQNGKTYFTLTLVAVFDPPCSPPMTVAWSDVTVTDVTSGISTTVPAP